MAYDKEKLTKLSALEALANRVKTELDKIPEELFLDQTKTAFVGSFTWSAEIYPGSTDPELNGKPVMVLAVKGEGGTTNYSFLDMAKLVDTYTAKTEGKDASTVVEIAGYEMDVKVNISQAEGNQLQLRPDGLHVAKTEVEVATDAEVTEMLNEIFGTTA